MTQETAKEDNEAGNSYRAYIAIMILLSLVFFLLSGYASPHGAGQDVSKLTFFQRIQIEQLFPDFLKSISIALMIAVVVDLSWRMLGIKKIASHIAVEYAMHPQNIRSSTEERKRTVMRLCALPSDRRIGDYSGEFEKYTDNGIDALCSCFGVTQVCHDVSTAIKATIEDGVVCFHWTHRYAVTKIPGSDFYISSYSTDPGQKKPTLKIFDVNDIEITSGFNLVDDREIFEEQKRKNQHSPGMPYKASIRFNDEINRNCNTLTIEWKIFEKQHDHWGVIGWSCVMPTRSLSVTVNCLNDLVVKNYDPFVYESEYLATLTEKDYFEKTDMSFSWKKWMYPGQGYSIMIAKK